MWYDIVVIGVMQTIFGIYVGYRIGFLRGRLEGFTDAIVHLALVLRRVNKEVDTVTNGPYVVQRVLNLMGIEEVYNLAENEVLKEEVK